MTKQELREKATQVWRRLKAGNMMTEDDKRTMLDAYWSSALPQTDDCIGQWVEDGMPPLS